MAMTVINAFTSLQNEFEEAQKGLKEVDNSIRKVTGRDPGLVKAKPTGNNRNRLVNSLLQQTNLIKSDLNVPNDEPPRKRRFFGNFTRPQGDDRNRFSHANERSIRYSQEDESNIRKPTLQSSVIATPKEVKPRTQALEEQKSDKRGMARNKRMFGMILGTLQKFQNEESQRKDTTQRRVEIEKKLDAAQEEEKEKVKKERRELFLVRREKQAQIRRIERKMERVEIHQEWEKSYQHFGNYIQTKTKPQLFYLPAKHTPETEKKLQETKDKFRLILAEKRAKVQKELAEIDELYQKNEVEEEEQDEQDNDNDNEMEEENFELKENSNHVSKEEKVDSQPQDIEMIPDSIEHENNSSTEHKVKTNEQEPVKHGSDEVPPETFEDKEFEPIYDE